MAKDESAQAEPVKETSNAGTSAKADAAAEPKFSGSQLIRAASGISRDIMAAALSPDGQYTETEAKSMIDKFLKKEVVRNGGRKLDNSK